MRSGRTLSTKLNKGDIPSFCDVVEKKFNEIAEDIPLLKERWIGPDPQVVDGSCLTKLRELPDNAFTTIITSPPYANRYDYTRTYALELSWLGYGETEIKNLRQNLLSATVENRCKRSFLQTTYEDYEFIDRVLDMVDQNEALLEVLTILREHSVDLGNRNIIRLIKNYFTEMAMTVSEFYRVMRPKGTVFMINDNVQYHGEELPVDLILSDFAEQLGFTCKCIWVLPRGKGNASQQMGKFGRREIRKCLYQWEKI